MKTTCGILLLLTILFSVRCDGDEDEAIDPVYRQYMRDFVQDISQYARTENSAFIVIPQNGQELVTENGEEDGQPVLAYLRAIDGVGREDLFFGYDEDNRATPSDERDYMISYLDVCESNGVEVLVTDYCWTHSKMDDSYRQSNNKGYISFAAPDRELRKIPDYPALPFNLNNNDVIELSDARNFLYLINPEEYLTRQAFIGALAATSYDVLIMDYFYNAEEFTPDEIEQLKTKNNGGHRLVIAYMSIGEAEDYRYYWNPVWNSDPPSWLKGENPDWEGNYKVAYWDPGWQRIIFGNPDAYLNKIIDKGFDGVYLDIIDAFEYFE
ncbi:MAG: endo alpha-1,4 polygalactosaminidase [Bacteroidales bacterium]|nr:endo alpha-1,4 polygalactosaminidase [Bacteroidales bacterium]